MRYAFTDRTRKVLARAVEEAVRLGHDYVGTEHMLLGLLADEDGLAAAVLDELGVARAEARRRIEEAVRPGRGGRGSLPKARGELPYTSRAKKTLQLAMTEARAMSHAWVGTEHLLLGLLAEERGIAAQVLRSLGATLEGARAATHDVVWRASGGGGGAAPDDGEPASGFRVRIDDESSSSIYEQIVAQIREAVATGTLGPGERLQAVRRLADELDIAPGTVARAYRELERLGVVETDGARGTRVAEPQRDVPPKGDRRETLVGLLRPVAVAAFHMGASAGELRDALGPAMDGILADEDAA